MRRTTHIFLFAVILLLSFSISYADSYISHSVERTEVEISFPHNWYYADYSVNDKDAICTDLGQTANELRQYFDETGTSFIAVSYDVEYFISLSIEDTDFADFTDFTDTVLISIGNTLSNQLTSYGYDVLSVRVSKHIFPFIKIRYDDSASGYQYYDFTTVKDNKKFTVNIMNKSFKASDDTVINSIMDTFSVSAKYREYYIDSVQMHVEIPADFIVADKQESLKLDPSGKYQFYAYNTDKSFQFHVDMINPAVEMKNLNLFSESELQSMSDFNKQIIETHLGTENCSSSIEEINGIIYLKTVLGINVGATTIQEINYTTILHNRQFSIAFDPECDSTGQPDPAALELIEDIIKRVQFDSDMTDPNNSFKGEDGIRYDTYTINNPDVSIKIPSNYNVFWRNMPANAYSLYITGDKIDDWDEKFSSNPYLMLMADTENQTKLIGFFIGDTPDMPDINSLEISEIQRYIKSVEAPQSNKSGFVNKKYKIIRTDRYAFILSLKENPNDDYFYSFSAFTYQNGNMIKLSFDSQKPISEEEISSFIKSLLSICINKKEQKEIESTDWFVINDISPYKVNIGDINIYLPAQYMYYMDNISTDDLCLNAMDIQYSSFSDLLNSIGSVMYAFPYAADEGISVLTADANGYPDYTIDYYSGILEENNTMINYLNSMGVFVLNKYDIISPIRKSDINSPELYWLMYELYNQNANISQIMLTTIYNGQVYTIDFEKQSYTDDDIQMLIDMVHNISFNR